jgi:hypothetical protein
VYSPLVIDKKLFHFKKSGVLFTPYSIADSITITSKLTKKLYDEEGERRKNVSLSDKERQFIKSETLLCRNSFPYWAERYGFCEMDAQEGGGVAPAEFWPSQERALKQIGDREEANYRELKKYGSTAGIRGVWHKTRQQGATALMRLINGHRWTLFKHTRCIAASLDEAKVLELYKRDKIVLDNLPFFLQPTLEYDTKCQSMTLEYFKSTMLYQQANQQAGVGTSQQFDISHMTEVGLWALAERLQFDFLPAVPKALTTLVAFESTANGRDNWWHKFTELVRKQAKGFESWIYVFTPWYINYNKNSLNAPDDWIPSDATKEHAELIERTSFEFAGQVIRPNRNQLYWWESEYDLNRKMGTLNIFFSNYPATPEQSFQHHAQNALPVDVLDWMRNTSIMGMPYHLELR